MSDPFASLGRGTSPDPPRSNRRWRTCARNFERVCCSICGYFPLAIVYGLTTWAVWVEASIGLLPAQEAWTGHGSTALGVFLWAMLNLSYSIAVFTDPGSPLNATGYSQLPTQEMGEFASLTVKSSGALRFCKKCRTKKPDRAHHCSTCRRCVLKMDHHCPWLATCVGLRNYKPFLLFLAYTTLFCWLSFAVAATWLWGNFFIPSSYAHSLMPVNYIMLAVLAGIIGLTLAGFTGWHLYLTCTGQTTIESLEKTRYLAPLRHSMQRQLSQRHPIDSPPHNTTSQHHDPPGRRSLGDQLREIHANALPGVTRPEEGEERSSPLTHASPAATSLRHHLDPGDAERLREQQRYAAYLDERDAAALPNAFDLGVRRNLAHVFGRNPALWALPVRNTTGDGWRWEASPAWLRRTEEVARAREDEARAQERRERAAGWGDDGEDEARRGFVDRSPMGRAGEGARRYPPPTPQPPLVQFDDQYRTAPNKASTVHGTLVQDHDGRDGSDDGDDEEADWHRRRMARRQRRERPTAQAGAQNWNDVPDDFVGSRQASRSAERSRGRRERAAPAVEGWQDWGPS